MDYCYDTASREDHLTNLTIFPRANQDPFFETRSTTLLLGF